MWIVPMQTASYKGVVFDVITISDTADRAIVEHAYPYINGADIEDMGLNAKQVQVQAIFNGDGYYTDLKKLLSALQKRGAGVLVHPILGRMPNMLCVSHSITHDAENVNYCSLDLTFKEASEAEPIFVFEASALTQLDSLFHAIDDFLEQVLSWFNALVEGVSYAAYQKNKLLSFWSGIYGVVMQLRHLFQRKQMKFTQKVESISEGGFAGQKSLAESVLLDNGQTIARGVTKQSLARQSTQAIKFIHNLLSSELKTIYQSTALTTLVGFDEVVRKINEVEQQAKNLATGKGEGVMNQYQSLTTGGTRITKESIKPVDVMVKLLCTVQLVKIGRDIFEQYQDELSPVEIEHITTTIRLKLFAALNAVREWQQIDERNVATQRNDIYISSHQMGEKIRFLAHQLTKLAVALINQKPPLVVKASPLNGTIQQIAHAFYGNYQRAAELLRLNPQIRLPNFMREGDLINAYAE